jgi:hypothetical protein
VVHGTALFKIIFMNLIWEMICRDIGLWGTLNAKYVLCSGQLGSISDGQIAYLLKHLIGDSGGPGSNPAFFLFLLQYGAVDLPLDLQAKVLPGSTLNVFMGKDNLRMEECSGHPDSISCDQMAQFVEHLTGDLGGPVRIPLCTFAFSPLLALTLSLVGHRPSTTASHCPG